MTLTHGSLFSGIGGIDLGFERAGIETIWQVENDDYATRVLEKHWPDVRRWRDVRTFPPDDSWPTPDIISGGFPCQDLSVAGKQAGLGASRSGLWGEMPRIIRHFRPRIVVVENVGGLADKWLPAVLGDLAALGYDAEWAPVSAAAVGAIHRRRRIFIIAYTSSERLEGRITAARLLQGPIPALDHLCDWPALSEPFGVRSLNGIPGGVDRLKCLGNSVVPQVAEWIGRRIVDAGNE